MKLDLGLILLFCEGKVFSLVEGSIEGNSSL